MLCNNVQQCTTMSQQQTIMWRWYCIDVAWCLLMCNNMFICYYNVSMYPMIWQWYKYCYNVVQQYTNMLTTDKQCYIVLQHSDNGVTTLCNTMLRCDNNVTMCNNVQLCSDTCTWCYNDMYWCTTLWNTMLRCASMLQHSYDDVEHVFLCYNDVVTVYFNVTLQLHKRTMLH